MAGHLQGECPERWTEGASRRASLKKLRADNHS
jgi:hypothetical protein